MNEIDLNRPIKLKFPEVGEENVIYKVVNYNELTKRCYIEPINLNLPIPSQELISINEIENV